ncbi:cobyric acid synthase [Pseudomonadota bacterium]
MASSPQSSATPRALMVQGTGSDAGKSLLVAGLARAFVRRGLTVAPFKPQNMSNNAAVTIDGGEIGRAQALQARAAGVEPTCDMNPVLLKPEGETGAQLVVGGEVRGRVTAQDFRTFKDTLLPEVLAAFERLKASYDLVLVEGAGSPSEVNLRAGDIANMGFATAAGVPVVLAGDVEKGGVIAQVVGTHAVLMPSERDLIKGFIINKFRGDVSLFDAAVTDMQARTGWAGLGVVGWFEDAGKLPKEDSASLGRWAETGLGNGQAGRIRIGVLKTPRLSNFDDLDPLMAEDDVEVLLIEPGQAIPGDLDLVVLAGSKAVISDLRFVKDQDWDVDLKAHVNRGGLVVGLCGGYQMLGQRVSDPDGLEGEKAEELGLGLLDVETVLTDDKALEHVRGQEAGTDLKIAGYEMHLGLTEGPGRQRPWLHLDALGGTREDGAVSENAQIMGAYVHGLFAADEFRHGFLSRMRENRTGGAVYEAGVEAALDGLAEHLERCLDLDKILELAT